MIGRLNHVAIAVRDIAKAAKVYRDTLGAEISATVKQPDHGVSTVFINLPNTKIELLEPLGEDSPISKFLDKNPDGGIHHVCYEVPDITRRARHPEGARRARARRRRAEDRRARQAGAVPASEGFLRHAGRTGAGVGACSGISDGRRHRHRDLFHHLVGGAVRRAALGRAQPAESGEVTPGTEPGAPAVHLVWRKLLWTTVTAAVVFGIATAAYKADLIPFEFLKRISNPPHS